MKNLLPTIISFIKLNSTKITIIALSLISAGAIATSIWAIWFRETPALNPDYAAKETEKDAEKIEGSEGGEGEVVDGGKINIVYSPEATVDISDKKVSLLIGNLAKSKHNIVFELVIQDEVILQSGSIQPGYRVVNTDIADSAANMLSAGVYNGVMRLYMYDVQTNEREMLSTDIVVQITVKE